MIEQGWLGFPVYIGKTTWGQLARVGNATISYLSTYLSALCAARCVLRAVCCVAVETPARLPAGQPASDHIVSYVPQT